MSLQSKSPTSLKFKVHRYVSELVTPVKPTPYEFKKLSVIDNLDAYKLQTPIIAMYSHIPSKNGVDPVEVIRKAIAETLVFYYPLAGRLREDPTGKLVVECTGEGVLFTEAYADVTLEQFGYPVVPPIPCFDQLIFDDPSSSHILNTPLVLVQVTRLKCGGFIFGIRINHTIFDATGLGQFMYAIGEIARGATSPSVLPLWERHIIRFNTSPQKLISPLLESDMHIFNDDIALKLGQNLYHQSFFLGPTEILALKRHVHPHLRNCTSFEIVTASVMKCRIIAFQPHPKKQTNLSWSINLRSKLKLPVGYYGNVALPLMSKTTTAEEIIENPLSYTLQLMLNEKDKVVNIEDYIRTLVNLKVNEISYSSGDWRYAGFEKMDVGWGEAVYAGLNFSLIIGGSHLPYKNKNGEDGIMLSQCLPKQVMERFEKELNNMLRDQPFSRDEDVVQSKL